MKKLLAMMVCGCVAIALSMGTTGCTKPTKSPTPISPTAKTPTDKTPTDKTPTVKTPTDKTPTDKTSTDKDTKLEVKADKVKIDAKPGDMPMVKLMLIRGKDAKKDVMIDATSDKEGVKASADMVKGDASEGMLKITVAPDAKDGEYKITVKAKSENSTDATDMVTVNVKGAAVVEPPMKEKKVVEPPMKEKVESKEKKTGSLNLMNRFFVQVHINNTPMMVNVAVDRVDRRYQTVTL